MARYMRSDLGPGHVKLRPPVVVGAGIAWHGPGVYFISPLSNDDANLRRRVQSDLRPPRVIGAAVVAELPRPIKIWLVSRRVGYDLLTRRAPYFIPPEPIIPPLPPAIKRLIPRRNDLIVRQAHPALFPPPVIGAGIVYRPLQVELTYSRRGQPKSILRSPAVVGAGIVYRALQIELTYSVRGEPKSALRPPIIPPLARPSIVWLAPSTRGAPRSVLSPPAHVQVEPNRPLQIRLARITPPPTHPQLLPPADIGPGIVYLGILVRLTYSRRGEPQSRLAPPVVVGTPEVFYGPSVNLTYARRPVPQYDLAPPFVINQAQGPHGGVIVSLAPSLRGKAKYLLRPPTVVEEAAEAFYGPQVTLALSRRPLAKSALRPPIIPLLAQPLQISLTRIRPAQTRSRLVPPAVIQTEIFFGPQITLAYSLRGAPKSLLRPPAVVGAGIVYRPLQTELTYSQRGIAKSQLRPAVVTEAEVVFQALPIQTSLVLSFRIPIHSQLAAPVVIGDAIVWHGPGVYLTRERRPVAKSFLRPPVTVEPVEEISYGPQVWLAYARRGKAQSLLRAPLVVLQPGVRPALIALADSRRGQPQSFLRPPVIPPLAEATRITLASRPRTQTRARLSAPAAIRAGIVFRPLQVELTYSRRGKPRFFLRPPVIALPEPLVARPIFVSLAESRRGRPFYKLRPALVVRLAVEIYGPRVYLTPSSKPQVSSVLRPPTLPGAEALAPFAPISVWLTPSPKPQTFSRLASPAVVQPKELVFFGPQVSIIRIRPPRTISSLPGFFVPFQPPQGDVCGFDIAASFVCGSTAAGAKVTGSDSAGGSVSGSDQKAT